MHEIIHRYAHRVASWCLALVTLTVFGVIVHCVSNPIPAPTPTTPAKMATISQTAFTKFIFLNEKLCILIQIWLKFVHMCPGDNKSTLVQVMAKRRTGDKSLSEPMLSQFTDVYMRRSGDTSPRGLWLVFGLWYVGKHVGRRDQHCTVTQTSKRA